MLEALESRSLLSGTFTPLVRATPNAANTMMLETDGTVLMEGGGVNDSWYRLTPDSNGSYVNGTWTRMASMSLERLYYGSAVLPDGRILLQGGEYTGPLSLQTDDNTGEIYDPLTNTWSSIAPFPRPRFGDNSLELLPDGNVLAGYLDGPETFLYNPTTNVWSPGGTKLRDDPSEEENWVKLPDDSILSYDITASIALGVGHAQRYVPSTNTWVDAGIVPVALTSAANGSELGPGLLLPDGRVFYLGATGNTAYYTPSTNSWTAGPVIPGGLVADDVPAANLPDGNLLFTADTPLYQGPAHLFEFNPITNVYTDLSSALPAGYLNGPAFIDRMLVLPTGQILLNNGSSQLYVFTPSQGPLAVGVPAITGISQNPDGSFLLSGTLLNGISEGAYYGDDAEMATNYPIVRLTDASNHVFYARTFNWSSTGVATGNTPQSTDFTLPPGLPANTYAVTVVANGVPSSPVSLTIPTLGNDPAATIVSPATANPNPVAGTTARLSVLGADPVKGEATLTYFWAATTVPSGVIFPSFSANGTNAAKNVTVTFYHAGAYRFQVTVTNLAGLSTTSSVQVTVSQTASIVTVTPAPAGLGLGASQQFSASAQDQFGLTLTVQPSFVWSIASGAGTLSSTGLYTAPSGTTGTLAMITATTPSGSASGSSLAYVLSSAWSTQDIGGVGIAGAAGDDGNGTFGLAGSGGGFAGVVFDAFRFAYQTLNGDGVIVARIADQESQNATALASVMIRSDLTSGSLMAAMGITAGGVIDFADRAAPSSISSSTSGGLPSSPAWVRLVRSGSTFTGFTSSDGLTWSEWASATIAMGSTVYIGLAVTGASSSVLDTVILDHVSIELTPTVATAASAAPGVVTGTTTNLSVLGGDALGESTLTYTWAATAVPAGAPNPTFALNGTNAARNDTVTFGRAGNYTFTVTITNPGGLSTTSVVSVSVNQTLTTIIVTPPAAALSAASTQSFSATASDQFGQGLAAPPTFTWSVAGGGIGGTISAAGLYARPSPGLGNDTVVAAAGARTGAATVTVTAGVATQLAVTTQPPSNVIAGSPFGLVVSAEDSFGNVAPSFVGSVSLPPENNPATLGGPLTVTASMGVATFSGLSLEAASPGAVLQAVAGINLGTATTTPFAVHAANVTRLSVLTQPTSVVAGSDFGLDVVGEDRFGNVVSDFTGGVTLALADNPAGATLGGTLTRNATQGVASFVGLSLEKSSSGVSIRATSPGLGGVTTNAIAVIPAAAAQLVVISQPPNSVTAGSAFGLQVEALDAFGNLASGYSGGVAVDLAENPGGASLTGTLTATAVLGVATFANVILNKASAGYTLSVSSPGLDDATTSALTVIAAGAAQLVTTPPPLASVAAGSGFGITIMAEDLYGNLAVPFSGSVTLTLADNPTGATLGGSTTVTASGGVATFSNLSLDKAGSGYALQASSSGVASAVTGSFTVTPAVATQLVVFTQPPGNVTAGSGFTVVVEVEDSFGNLDPNYAGTVILSLGNNPGGPGAMPGGPLMVSAASGIATFSNVILDKSGANYTLHAASGTLSQATTNPINVNAGAATQLVVIQPPPSSITAGSPFTLILAGADPFGNIDHSFTGSVVVTLAANPGGDSLGGTRQTTAISGVATFTDLKLTKAANGDTLHASSGLPGNVTTSPFRVTAAAATQLAVTTEPSSIVTAGSGFSLAVTAEDAYGNPSADFTGDVTLALGNNPAGDALGGVLTISASAGVASFANLTLDKVAAGATLVASSALGSDTTTPFAVTAAAATQLVVTTEPPPAVVAGDLFGLIVTAEDRFGNTDLTYDGTVTIGLGSAPAGATIGGTLSAEATGGVAMLTALTLLKVGRGYTLQVSSSLGVATTTPIAVSVAAAAKLVVTTSPPQSVAAGDTFGLVVMAEDRFGNVDEGYTFPVSLALAPGASGDTLGGTLNASPVGGAVVFTDLTLEKASPGVSVLVSSGTLTGATTGPIAVVAAHAAQLVVTSQPAATVTAGATFGLTATAEDRFGNIASSFADTVTIALTPGSGIGSLGGTLTLKAAAGIATFDDLMLTTAANNLRLQAFSTSLGGATSAPFAIVAARATQLVVTAEPLPSVIAGNGFDLVVQAEDPFGNTDLSFSGSVQLALASGAGGATLGGTLSHAAVAGVAAFSGLTLDKVGAGDTLQATSIDLAPATTNAITVAAAAFAQLVVSTQPPLSVTAGKTFGLTIEAEDRFGNLTPAFGGSVTLTLPNNQAGDTLGGTLTMIADGGMVHFSDLTLTSTAASDRIEASSAGRTVTTDPFAVIAAAAARLALAMQPPANVTAGNGFDLVVQAEDPYGNIDLGFSGVLSLALANASGGGSLGGTLSLPADAGVATFTGLSLRKAGSSFTLDVSSDDVAGVTTAPIAVAPAAATRLVVATQPPLSVTAGSGFGVVALAEDDFGNVDIRFSSTVVLTTADGQSVGGTSSMAASAGLVSFAGLTLNTAAAGTALRVTSNGLIPADTSAIAVVAASASQLVMTSPPPGAVTAGRGFGITVTAEDRFGNVDPDFVGSVTLSLASNPNGSALDGSLVANASGGVTKFSVLTLTQAAAGYTIAASSSGLTSAASGPITVGAAPASQLVVSQQPPDRIDAGAGFGLVALAKDPFGNLDTHFGGMASLSLATNPGNATLGGTLSVTASGGVAIFAGVSISMGGNGYSLVVTGGGLIGAVTSAFAVIPPPATVVSVAVQNQRLARHKSSTVIVVAFTEPLNAAAAANLGSYTLNTLTHGKGHKSKGVALARASYNPATNTVTLVPRNRLLLNPAVQLQIKAATLTDALGRPLDGNHDGQAGGNFLATLRNGGVSIASDRELRASGPAISHRGPSRETPSGRRPPR